MVAEATIKPFTAASLTVHVIIQRVQRYWKSSILDCEGTWVLICTCAYFNKAINFKLLNAKVQIAHVDGTYCVQWIIYPAATLSVNSAPKWPMCNRSQGQRGVCEGNIGYGITINSHTWFLFCIGTEVAVI